MQISQWGSYSSPPPSPLPFFPPLPSRPFLSFSHFLDLNPSIGSGERCKLLQRVRRSAVTKSILVDFEIKQVRKVLWTRKAPACLLTLLYDYGKPCLPPLHKYSSPLHRASSCRRPLRYTHCAGSIVVKVQCQVLNRSHETNVGNYLLIKKYVKNLRR